MVDHEVDRILVWLHVPYELKYGKFSWITILISEPFHLIASDDSIIECLATETWHMYKADNVMAKGD